MKLDEDLGPDRQDEFQTDDEENQAERNCDYDDDDDVSQSDDLSPGSRNSSDNYVDVNTPSWPQSYRQSMDMFTSVTPPSISFLTGSSLTHRRLPPSDSESSLHKPLVSSTNLDKEGLPLTTPVQSFTSLYSILSVPELPPPREQCSVAQATLNGINVLCGIGTLAVPHAVREGGWLSLLLLLLFCIICFYTGILLKRCLEGSPGLKTYPDIGQAAFGMSGRLVIAIILYMELYASCIEYTILMSDNLATMFPKTHMYIGGMYLTSHQIFAIATTLVVLPTVWLRNLGLLSYLSAGGVVASILVVICLLWLGVVDQVGFHPSGTIIDLANLPFALGIYSFCYSGHSVFPNIYSSMKEPSKFPWVLVAAMGFPSIIYIVVSVCGFLMFGDKIKSQFTLNMPQQYMATKVAIWTTVVNPMTKYALTIMPVALSLEELLPSSHRKSYSLALIIRSVLVMSILIVALAVPFFGLVMALMGSLLAMLVAIVFPCACYLKMHKGRLTKLEIAACRSIIAIGISCSCIGTYSAFANLVDQRV
ncbi:amino acid transporter AVT1D [Syzygium oleosum]|uniref:amino acid transporter AVT1D n=1 Tax=Syzygium oleosum TaxID=219896 RepID=UPI0011D27CF9|nr:amino acid transporter AVT1D [Syzygium oleosum]